MKNLQKLLSVILVIFFYFTLPLYAQTDSGETVLPSEMKWPREIETSEAIIVIYQPQLEDFSDNRLRSRFAASVRKTGDDNEPVFGAVWVEARMETNRAERTVRLAAIENVRSRERPV